MGSMHTGLEEAKDGFNKMAAYFFTSGTLRFQVPAKNGHDKEHSKSKNTNELLASRKNILKKECRSRIYCLVNLAFSLTGSG